MRTGKTRCNNANLGFAFHPGRRLARASMLETFAHAPSWDMERIELEFS